MFSWAKMILFDYDLWAIMSTFTSGILLEGLVLFCKKNIPLRVPAKTFNFDLICPQ